MESPFATLPEVDSDPLSDMVLDFMIDHSQEEPYLDFKLTLSIERDSNFPETAKDLLAFSNYGGGVILIGYRDKTDSTDEWEKKYPKRYVPVGLPIGFHIDQAILQSKFDAYCNHPTAIRYREFTREIESQTKTFGAIYIPPSSEVLKALKSGRYPTIDGKTRTPFEVGAILFRHGTQSKPASKAEIEFIKRRVKLTQYKLSVLSGEPDRISEEVYSNLFEMDNLPKFIYSGKRRPTFWNPERDRQLRDYVTVSWNGKDISFENLADFRNPLWQSVFTETVSSDPFNSWTTDEDKQRIVERLLSAELTRLGREIGLRKDPDRLRFYFSCPNDSRIVEWTPRFRDKSQLVVAKKTYSTKLRRDICIHYAVNARFVRIQQRVFLRLSPTLVLTADGINLLSGEDVGPQITSLLHDRYNQIYLNNLLFWISQFAKNGPSIILAHGSIVVSSRPTTVSLSAGILADRPASEETPTLSEGDPT